MPARLTSAFILFFPPLPSPERRVRPKCMAQRYCPLGSWLRGAPLCHRRGPPLQPQLLNPAWHPGGTRGGGSHSPPATSSPRACLPAPLGEAPCARRVGGSLSWWGTAGDRFGGDRPGITPALCLSPHSPHPPSLDLSELAKAAKKKLQAVSGGQGRAGGRGGGGGGVPFTPPTPPDTVPCPAAAQQPPLRGAGHGRVRRGGPPGERRG